MKISMIKLKSRGYLIGNLPLLSLFLLTLFALCLCLNILPETATQLMSSQPENVRDMGVIAISSGVIFALFCFYCVFDMGLYRFFIRKAQNRGGRVKDLFHYFLPSESINVLSFFIRYKTMTGLLFTFCFAPFYLSFSFLMKLLKGSPSLIVTVVILLTSVLLFLTGLYFWSEVKASLFLVKFYFAKGDYLNFRQLVSSSQKEMRERKKNLKRLKLSFVWWFLSCVFVVPSIYVFLYYRQSKAVLASEIMKE